MSDATSSPGPGGRPTNVILGSNQFLNSQGYLQVQDEAGGPFREFLRVRDIDRKRSSGYYLVLDVDIKTPDGEREVKLAKTRPVAGAWDQIDIVDIDKGVEVRRRDNQSLIIKVEEVDFDPVPKWMCRDEDKQMIRDSLAESGGVPDKAMQITGEFYAGPYLVVLTPTHATLNGNGLGASGNLTIGGDGIRLFPGGFGW
jgi:hypothetical protein